MKLRKWCLLNYNKKNTKIIRNQLNKICTTLQSWKMQNISERNWRFILFIYLFLKLFLNVCLFLRERQRQRASWAEREEDTESKAASRLWAVSTEPNAGLELMNGKIMTWAKVRRLTNWATQVPRETKDLISRVLYHVHEMENSISKDTFKCPWLCQYIEHLTHMTSQKNGN